MDRRDERRRRVAEMRAGGESFRDIASTLGISAATALRDARTGSGAGSSTEVAGRPVAASGEPGAGTWHRLGQHVRLRQRGQGDRRGLRSARSWRTRTGVSGATATGAPCSTRQRGGDVLAAHDIRHLRPRSPLRDQQWVSQLQAALRRLQASGAEQAETILNEMLDNIAAITKAGRPKNRS